MVDPRWNDISYHTVAVNDEGLEGTAYIENGQEIKTSSPMNNHEGFNPEQLLGLSLSTCLKATLQAIEKEKNLADTAKVHVEVGFLRRKVPWEFLVHARIAIPGVSLDEANEMAKSAEKRCPVSQLLSGSKNYTVEVVNDF